MFTAPRDARRWSWSTARPAASSPATWSPARSSRTSPTPWCSPPAATATSSTSPPTPRAATSPPSGAPTRRARPSPTPATRRSTRPASRSRRLPVEAHPHVASRCATTAASGCRRRRATPRPPHQIPEDERDYYLERMYPATATSPRATSPPARPSRSATRAAASGPGGRGVYLDFADAIERLGEDDDRASATATSSTCTSASPTRTPTRCRCASTRPSHYTMGGLWVDYNLMSNIPGLLRARRGQLLRPRRQPPRGLALMQGLADGYFVLPYTIGNYLAVDEARARWTTEPPRVQGRPRPRSSERMTAPALASRASARSTSFHRELGKIMWEHCGMAPQRGRPRGRRCRRSRRCARSSGRTSTCPGNGDELNQSLEKAGRVADFLELGELMCLRRARARGVLRRPLPRGVPDRRGRGAARRRAASATSPPGSTQGEGKKPDAQRRAARRSRTCTSQTRSYK